MPLCPHLASNTYGEVCLNNIENVSVLYTHTFRVDVLRNLLKLAMMQIEVVVYTKQMALFGFAPNRPIRFYKSFNALHAFTTRYHV